MTAPDDTAAAAAEQAPPSALVRFIVSSIRGLLSVALLAATIYGAWWMIRNPPQPKRRRPPPQPAFVEVTPVSLGRQRVSVPVMGKVRAAEEVDLTPRVKGEVMHVSRDLAPGNLVRKGQTLLRIDAADYQVTLQQAEAAVRQAESNLALEEGKQSVARREYELLGKDVKESDRDLVLRQPQLVSARAALATAKAALGKARLDLGRTTLSAPFNAIVQAQLAYLGARVTEASVLAKLVGTDAFWVELVVPVDALRWIRAPQRAGEEGDPVKIFDPASWGNGAHRVGRIFRLAADLEEKGRMAKVLVRVEDPLALAPANAGKPRLIIGSYVRAEIAGSEIPSVAVLDRRLIRDGKAVWLMGPDDKLEIRPVEIVFGNAREVYVTGGLKAGERVVSTDLATPVPGLLLRLLKPGATRLGMSGARP